MRRQAGHNAPSPILRAHELLIAVAGIRIELDPYRIDVRSPPVREPLISDETPANKCNRAQVTACKRPAYMVFGKLIFALTAIPQQFFFVSRPQANTRRQVRLFPQRPS